MTPSSFLDRFRAQHWDTPLISLRALALLIFLCTASAMLFPYLRGFLAGAAVSLSGGLVLHLFRASDIVNKPMNRDVEPTTLGLNNG